MTDSRSGLTRDALSDAPDRLYELLPVVYRQRDAEQGGPLRALLRVIAQEVAVVEADIAQLYENWFIETCQDWVVPYIGDLIGYRPVHEAGEPREGGGRAAQQRNKILIPRCEVANTLRYRRRKGALSLLELLANDVAGWPARAVEFYTLLALAQSLNHLHRSRGQKKCCHPGQTADLRRGDLLDRLDGPFDRLAHTVEVRRFGSPLAPGRYNIPGVGLFVWRLRSYSVTQTPADCLESIAPHLYTFSVLGNAAPLYTRREPEIEPTHIAGEFNVPAPIRRRAFEERKSVDGRERSMAAAAYYGPDRSLAIWAPHWPTRTAPQPIPRESILPADLSDLNDRRYHPPRNYVAVDPVLGRIAFPPRQLPKEGVLVTYHYGFSADIGGGEYERPLSQEIDYLLRRGHLKDAPGLAARLRDAPDALSRYLQRQLSPETQARLTQYESGPVPEPLERALLAELNRLLQGASLYEERRFMGVTLTAQTRRLIEQNDSAQGFLPLNRRLLEEAYPDLIARSYVLYSVSNQEQFVAALERWRREQPASAVIEITKSGVYMQPLNVELGEDQSLQIRAADRVRPVIRLLDWQTDRPDALRVSGEAGSRFVLDGLLITGRGVQVEGGLAELVLRHCTLVPGWSLRHDCEPRRPAEPSLELNNVGGRVVIAHSILGAIQVNNDEVEADPLPIFLSDSLLDATSSEREAVGAEGWPLAHAVLAIVRCTVFGQIQTHAIDLAENSLFTGLIRVARRQRGCMRFCAYVQPGSRTPPRYHCQPDLTEQAVEATLREEAQQREPPETPTEAEIAAAQARERERVIPQFASVRYGAPTYGRLADSCAEEITRGADDESEMGVYHDLYQPQRAANLRARLDEYTPAGMDAGIVYAD